MILFFIDIKLIIKVNCYIVRERGLKMKKIIVFINLMLLAINIQAEIGHGQLDQAKVLEKKTNPSWWYAFF